MYGKSLRPKASSLCALMWHAEVPVTNGRSVYTMFVFIESDFVSFLFQLLSACFAPAAFLADPVMS